jgi:tRNA 5-methylaminomethyl-2-thiouridine biosynthesis bifunctional protein
VKPDLSKILDAPKIGWTINGGPRSELFSDLYYSDQDPLGEVEHVFLGGIGAPDVWADRARFVIGETGFGSGLNFLATWQLWNRTAPPGAQLDYVSLEAYPLAPDDLQRALDRFPELAGPASQLVAQYPPANPGVHRLRFENGRLRLTLLYGEAAEVLSNYEASIDAWYLDGFAPRLNPEMWRLELFKEVARRSAPGARLASFTAAGNVRRGLEAVGFKIEKRPGFGAKRHAISGRFDQSRNAPCVGPRSVAIIGGGIAGCALAWACDQRGLEVILIERHQDLAAGASGNPAALVKPRLMLGNEVEPRFLAAAALYADRFYREIAMTGVPIWYPPPGAVELASDQQSETRLQRIAEVHGWSADMMRFCDQDTLARIIGAKPPFGGLYFPTAGCLDPAVLCPALAAGARRIEAEVAGLERRAKGWAVHDKDAVPIAETDVVVIAAGIHSDTLMAPLPSPLRANRGQLGYLAPAPEPLPKVTIGYGGYLTPRIAIPGFGEGHILGASFDDWPKERLEDASTLRPQDFARIMERLRTAMPDLAVRWSRPEMAGRAAIRARTPDHLPLAGWLDEDGRFLLTGFGSRGFLAAPLAAELVACQIVGAPPPIEADLAATLDPWRFEMRRMGGRKTAN